MSFSTPVEYIKSNGVILIDYNIYKYILIYEINDKYYNWYNIVYRVKYVFFLEKGSYGVLYFLFIYKKTD